MSALPTSKRTTPFDLKATFDSDESDWSENEDEAVVGKEEKEKLETVGTKDNPGLQVPLGKADQSLYSNDDFGQGYSSAYTYSSYESTSKRNNSASKEVSPKFKVGEKVNNNSIAGFAKGAHEKISRQETFNISTDDVVDDWDEESCAAANFKKFTALGESMGEKVSEKDSPRQEKEIKSQPAIEKKGNFVDWSETYSDGSESDVEEDGGVENPPLEINQDQLIPEPAIVQGLSSSTEVREEIIERRNPGNSSPVIEEKPMQRQYSKSSSPDDRASIETKIIQDEDEPINSSTKDLALPTSSSAAQLFCVADTPTTSVQAKRIPSAFDLTSDQEQLPPDSKSSKKPKPSSAKQFISRLFSTDHEKPVRKNSEPLPLSTLLLNVPLSSSQSEGELLDVQAHQNGSMPSSAARYFPPPQIEGTGMYPHSQTSQMEQSALPKKRKGFIGKMKKSLGISSKGSKMRGTESMKSIPLVPTTSVTTVYSDPGISGAFTSSSHNQLPIHELTAYEEYSTGRGEGDAHYPLEKPTEFKTLNEMRNFIRTLSAPVPGKSCNSLVDDLNSKHSNPGKFSSEGKMSNMNRPYCAQAKECCQNRQLIYSLLDDLCCVLDKTFGEHDNTKRSYGSMCEQVDELKDCVECGQATKLELERKLEQQECELSKLRCCLEEERQARMNLEDLVCELKSQIDRQDDALNCEVNEKARLLMALKKLESDNLMLKSTIGDFDCERDAFSKTCKGFEGTKNKCSELQKALAECCEKHDLMQKEIMELRNENNEIKLQMDNCVFEKNKAINDILQNDVFALKADNNDLKRQLDKCAFEKTKILNEMEMMRQTFAAEKAELERKICELLEGIDKLEKAKAEVCKQTNIMLAAHHEEMDKLKMDADNYKAQLEQEIKCREESLRSGYRQSTPCPGYRSGPSSPSYQSRQPQSRSTTPVSGPSQLSPSPGPSKRK